VKRISRLETDLMADNGWKLLDDDAFNPLREKVTAEAAEARLDGYYDLALKRLREAATGQSGQFTAAEIEMQAPETVDRKSTRLNSSHEVGVL
jgi:hypothetical protein